MVGEETRLFDPVSRSMVDAGEVGEALRRLAPKPYEVSGGIKVYHATTPSAAKMLLRRGFIPATKPRSRVETYAPGRGIDQGLYVGASARAVGGYGPVVLEVTVPRKELSVPTEMAQLGETSPRQALKSHDGAIIKRAIPSEAFRVVGGQRYVSAARVASRYASRDKHGYHATFLKNLDSIGSHGLLPSGGSQFSGGYEGHSRGRVFLSDWGGVDFWMSKMENLAHHNSDFKDIEEDAGWTPVTLRVDVKEWADQHLEDLEEDAPGSQDSYSGAFWTDVEIEPEFIEVWDGRKWTRVRSVDTAAMTQEVEDASSYESDSDEEYDEYGQPTGWWEMDFEIFAPGKA